MARWRLKQKHYLMVPNNEWQYIEQDRVTGRPKRVNFPVPRYLDPTDYADCNYVERGSDGTILNGEIIVTNDLKTTSRDIPFYGDPTPDMEPLDEEAKTISASFKDVWKHPIETLPEQGYSMSILREIETQLSAIKPAQSVSVGGVEPAQFTALQDQVTELIKQNTLIMEQMLAKSGVRRM